MSIQALPLTLALMQVSPTQASMLARLSMPALMRVGPTQASMLGRPLMLVLMRVSLTVVSMLAFPLTPVRPLTLARLSMPVLMPGAPMQALMLVFSLMPARWLMRVSMQALAVTQVSTVGLQQMPVVPMPVSQTTRALTLAVQLTPETLMLAKTPALPLMREKATMQAQVAAVRPAEAAQRVVGLLLEAVQRPVVVRQKRPMPARARNLSTRGMAPAVGVRGAATQRLP